MYLRLSVLFGLLSLSTNAFCTPDWVTGYGKSAKFPATKFLVGFGSVEEGAGLEEAKLQAAGELSKYISVRIEHETRDYSAEKNGQYSVDIAAVTSASSDVRLSNVSYEVFEESGRIYVLAYLERSKYAADRRAARDRGLAELDACMASAKKQEEEKQEANALSTYLSCKKSIPGFLEEEAVARAVAGTTPVDDDAQKKLIEASRVIDDRVAVLLKRPSSTLRDAVETLAIQLKLQGVSPPNRLLVAPLTYGTSAFSSPFGKQAAVDLERAIAQELGKNKGTSADLAVRGTYSENGDRVKLVITARYVENGKLVGGAEASFPKAALPENMALLPHNFAEALKLDKLFAEGEQVSGELSLEVWTNKGAKSLVFTEGEEMKLYLRVNRPAYVRLIYILSNGLKIPIEQSYFVDANKVNKAVEYPQAFEVSPPFGIEQIFAVAFTEQPPPLPTVKRVIDGEEYEVIGETSTLVKYRAIKKKKESLTAETTVSLATMAK